jgi:4-hydroxybenzoate polyprenyltransferase
MLSDIKIAHSVFAMPFALLGGAMAAWPPPGSGLEPVAGQRLVWIAVLVVAAMVAARTAAMLSNRLLDRGIDARNPRTAGRPLAAGSASAAAYGWGLAVSAAAVVAIASVFWWAFSNPWPVMLSLPVLAWICAYGLFKRFSSLCHIWLGASLAISVPAAAVAVDPSAVASNASVWLLAGMVLCWVAGFDVIYALQDVEVDRAEGLHSMPARLGAAGAVAVSRSLHVAAVLLLLIVWTVDVRFGGVFLAGVCVVTTLLVIEHATLKSWGTSRMAVTFFTLNGIVACVLGAAGIADLVM